MQFGNDVAYPLSHRADAGTLRVQTFDRAANGQLGPMAGFAGDGHDLDTAISDLGHLESEELSHQARVGSAERDLQAAHPAGHGHHVALDSDTVVVYLARYLLGLR